MADISKITVPSGSSYNLKDSSAVASIAKTSTGISYTTRAGSTTVIDGLASPIVISVDSTSLIIATTGTSLDVAVDTAKTTLTFTVVS